MKKPSKELFSLIHSLTLSEKRYIKLAISVHKGDKSYLKLFDVINKQVNYDEEKIKNQFQQEAFVKRLPAVKNYLYHLILKCLRAYHSNSSIIIQLKEHLHNIEILFDKGLYKQCEKIIAKAKKIAEQYENHLQLLELLNWEVKLMYVQGFTGKYAEKITHSFKKTLYTIDLYKNFIEFFMQITMMSSKLIHKGATRKNADVDSYQNIINKPLFKNESKALTFKALYYYYACYNTYYYSRNDINKTYVYAKKMVELMESHPHQIKAMLKRYIYSLDNIGIWQLHLKKYNEIPLTLKKLRAIPTTSAYFMNKIFHSSYRMELNMYIDTGQFDKGVELTEDFNTRNDKFRDKQGEMNLNYNNAYVYFGAEDYEKANAWLNKILNDTTINLRDDMLCFSQILHLIIHFEKDDNDLIEYRVKSAERFLSSREQLYLVEKEILIFFRKTLPKVNTNKDQVNAFKTLKIQMEKILKNTFERKALEYFDFISWIDSKIEGKTFAEIMKRNTLDLSN